MVRKTYSTDRTARSAANPASLSTADLPLLYEIMCAVSTLWRLPLRHVDDTHTRTCFLSHLNSHSLNATRDLWYSRSSWSRKKEHSFGLSHGSST